MFPVPWSSKWNWSLHLFLSQPIFLRPFGLYCSACFGILFVSILCTCFSHFSWYCFISFTMFCAPVFPLIHWFFPYLVFLFQISVSKISSGLLLNVVPLFSSKHQNTCKILKRKKLSYETQYMYVTVIVVFNVYYTCLCILRLCHISDLLKMLSMWAIYHISLLLTNEKQGMWQCIESFITDYLHCFKDEIWTICSCVLYVAYLDNEYFVLSIIYYTTLYYSTLHCIAYLSSYFILCHV